MWPSILALAPPVVRLAVLVLALGGAGCRPGRTVPRLPDAASVEALLRPAAGAEAPRSASGRASVRLRVGERDLPALSLSFSLREASQMGAVLRPGALTPVLSLWSGADGWALRFPRQKAAFDLEHEPGLVGLLDLEPQGQPQAGSTPTGPAVGKMGAWILAPHALLEDLRDVALRQEGEAWIVSGSPAGMGGRDLRVEVHLTAWEGAILRWSLKSEASTPLIQVEYAPPRGSGVGRAGQRIHFELAPLETVGTVRLDFIRAHLPGLRERPPLPEGWVHYDGSELGAALERLRESLAAER